MLSVARAFLENGRTIAVAFACALALVRAVGASAAQPASASVCEADARLLDVLLITIDTLRADHVGVYGGSVPTPAMDRLAHEGVWVRAAYTPTPTTGPAHASLLTGLHPWRHGVLDNGMVLGGQHATLAEGARAAGHRTGAFVSSYVLHRRFGLDRGFDDYEFVSTHGGKWRGEYWKAFYARGHETAARAATWLGERIAKDERFFLWVHLYDPHAPYEPPKPVVAPIDWTDRQVPPLVSGRKALTGLIANYRGEVRYVDAQVERVLSPLKRARRLDRTVVVVTSDHGEGLGHHGHLGHGANLYEELVRVPLIVRSPSVRGGRELDGPVQLEDLFPTLACWMGASVSATDGFDLRSWLRGEAALSRRAVLGQRKSYPGKPTLLFQRGPGAHKWIGLPDGHGEHYALEDDPREQNGERGSELPAELRAASPAVEAGPAPVLPPDVREALEALGYLE